MADTFTSNFNLTKPQVNGSDGTWGQKTNDNWDAVDIQLKANNTVSHVLSNGVATGDITVQQAFELEQTKVVYGGNF